MTKDEALKMAIKLMKEENLDLTDAYQACKEALEPQTNPEFDVVYHNVKHPAPSWQGLSLSEIYNIADKHGMIYHTAWEIFARAIEQALKEKNHG